MIAVQKPLPTFSYPTSLTVADLSIMSAVPTIAGKLIVETIPKALPERSIL
jgi:hypothetical protein